ncbi:hypothetical protein JOF29_002814 [Kribbella aluminosa]|uniref:Stress protein n=1 Tax=Kribbella aluminosa TaxID=416017 RepID=A0ABS4UJK0_9ACTN|nr:hypothetical protein [Kribbella aluminosa]MBP2351731.1 hypothetical protein [Kribbella aluminosa]
MVESAFATSISATTPVGLLAAERNSGGADRFTDVDDLAAALLERALNGNKIIDIAREHPDPNRRNHLSIVAVEQRERAFIDRSFTVEEQQSRGAWFLPEQTSLKCRSINLAAYVRHHPWHAISIASEDRARMRLAAGPDALAALALLIPLFDTIFAPIFIRASASPDPADAQRTMWAEVFASLDRIGINPSPALAVLDYGGGWSRLDRAGQAQARAAFLDALAAHNLVEVVTRFRAQRLQALAARTVQKAIRGTPLARQTLTKPLQLTLAAYFGGDWMAFLDYLGLPPNPNEEVTTALPTAKLFVGGASKAKAAAAEHGLDVGDAHAMLAAFLGQSDSVSPVDRRVEVLRRWWSEFDSAHARQNSQMDALWGIVEDTDYMIGYQKGPSFQLYQRLLPPGLLTDIAQYWEGTTLPRWPNAIVTEPYPHKIMAESFGSAVSIWHGIALTAWYICEGPYSRTSLEGLRTHHERDLAALAEAGTPIHPGLFDELIGAEKYLGKPQSLETHTHHLQLENGTVGIRISGGGERRDGFEILRDIITRHRRGWAGRHLDEYLKQRWTSELSRVFQEVHRTIAVKGKPPTVKQFARFAATAATHWFGGDLAGLSSAIGEKAPPSLQRVRLFSMPTHELIDAVYAALGGEPYEENLRITDFPKADGYRQRSRLATASVRYLQLMEALGRPPDQTEFGAKRYEWEWAGDLNGGWPEYKRAVEGTLNGPSLPHGA